MSTTASCLCGAARITLADTPTATEACHCGMCRKFSGGVLMSVEVKPDGLTVDAGDTIRVYSSSDWGERAFCGTCGSSLWYRLTAPGPHHGTYYVARGSLDGVDALPLDAEIFIDDKPGGYDFAGDHTRMTGAEVMEMIQSGDYGS